CLTSAFVFWCQRVFVEYLVQTPNEPLRQMLLPEVLEARRFGATGLSNAMKHLAGFEQLRLTARREHGRWVLDGFSPWVSNLAPGQFVVAVAADVPGERPAVFAVPAEAPGVERGDDFALLGLEATQTSSVRFSGVRLDPTWVISDDARSFLPRVRPAFMLFQCGLAWGLARRALEECRGKLDGHRHVLAGEAHEVARRLDALVDEVRHLASLVEFPLPALCRLFEARIALVDLALEAVRLELEACGGKGYFRGSGVERRLREAMFLPILTPSLVQLRTELNKVQETAS
ncbi:MAG TPA: acyl-CoA dehydrogenase family protein, partial [Chloroflexota bacterium]